MLKPALVSNNGRGEGRSQAMAVPEQQCEAPQFTELFAPSCLCGKGSLNYGNAIQGTQLTWEKGQWQRTLDG